MKKINIVELLKDCPLGIELNCTMYNNVTFRYILTRSCYPIQIQTPEGTMQLSKYGCMSLNKDAKCVIFPKGKTTWEGFVPPCQFKDGDIILTHADCLKVGVGNTWISIFKERRNGGVATYVDYAEDGSDYYTDLDGDKALLCMESDILRQRFATEEEKEKLFQAIRDNGYYWNSETKTLEKLVKLEFEIGDWVVFNNQLEKGSIYQVKNTHNYEYTLQHILGGSMPIPFSKVDMLKLWTIDDAKDGDVLVDKDNNIGIFQKFECIYWYSYIYLGCDGELRGFSIGGSHKQTDVHPATKEQRDLLFQKIKEAGYKWNSETKTLEKITEPSFEVGNRVRLKSNHNTVFTITGIAEGHCVCSAAKAFMDQDNWELLPDKFNISTLKPFDKVLVRDNSSGRWDITFYELYDNTNSCYPHRTLGGNIYKYCIPYEGNEHLLGKTDDCKDFYKTWK